MVGAHGVVHHGPEPDTVTKVYHNASDFAHEVRVLRELKGLPAVVHVVSIDESVPSVTLRDGGETLFDRIKRGPVLGWYELHYQVVVALGALHAAGVVHGDVKPENILVDANDTVRLCDFGHSRVLCAHERGVPCLRSRRGTLEYASPEILRGDRYDGFAADAWSVGVVLFVMVCGEKPFAEASGRCARYTVFFDSVVRVGCSPTETLAAPGLRDPWSTQTMATPLFSQNLDVLLQPLPTHRARMDDGEQ